MRWYLLDLSIGRIFAEIFMSLSQCLPTLDIKRGSYTFHVLIIGGQLFLAYGTE